VYRCRNNDYDDNITQNIQLFRSPPPAKRGQWVKLIARAGRSLISERDKLVRCVYTVHTRNDNN
jgi:hypothetical protein